MRIVAPIILALGLVGIVPAEAAAPAPKLTAPCSTWGEIAPNNTYVCALVSKGTYRWVSVPSRILATNEPAAPPTAAPTTQTPATAAPTTAATLPPTTAPAAAPTTAPASPAFQTVRLSGAGASLSQPFALDAGLVAVTLQHSGTRNFIVWLLDASGQKIELLANEIGPLSGTFAVGVARGGRYTLQVEADGGWTAEVNEPRSAVGTPVPFAQSGRGAFIAGPFNSTGTVRIRMSHSGRSNLIVKTFTANGRSSLLFNQIGTYSGETTYPSTGVFWVAIKADGSWSLDLAPF